MRALAALPGSLQTALRLAYVRARVTADGESFRTYRRLKAIRVHEGSGEETTEIRLRPLAGRPVAIRPSTSDADTVWGAFARSHHLPPPEVARRGIRIVWDMGANIGLTMAHFAVVFPQARVLGVELDAQNAGLARRNVAPWSDRCEVVEAAVWPADGEVAYERWAGGTAAFRASGGPPAPGAVVAEARSLDSLMAEHGGELPVDWLKLDVEGAERELLRQNTDWASRVRATKVEVHDPYTSGECVRDLERLGFDARPDRRHAAYVVGIRHD